MAVEDSRAIARFAALALLLALFALLSFGARQLSFTFDEPSHIASGYTFLARGARWTVPLRGHPLLVDAWLALPVYLGDPNVSLETLDGWDQGHFQDYLRYVEAFAPFLARALERSQVAARTPAMLLTLLLAAVVYRWAADLWDRWAGLLALGTLVFDPALLAHGRLATNDVGVTALGTLGLYLVWRWARVPTWRQAAVSGLVLGLTMLAKGSGLLWVAVGLSWATWIAVRKRDRFPSAWVQVLLVGILSLCVFWGAYGFSVGAIAGWLPIPVPAPQHWKGVLFHTNLVEERMASASWGLRAGNWLGYLPLAFLVKNPLPLLAALLLAIVALLGERRCWHRLQVLGLFSILYGTIIISQRSTIACRHVLLLHPVLYLLIAGGVERVWRRTSQIGRWAVAALGIWYIVGTVLVYPYELAFFNELVGGPENGWRYLADSNTDWGQAWQALRAFRREQALTFDYSGPEGYAGITPYELWDRSLPPLRHVSEPLPSPWLFPGPGDYVISANSLSGLWLVDPDNFAWFRYHAPDAAIARTLFYYHVDAALAPAWLAQCTVPVVPLDEDVIAKGIEGIDPRRVDFDCSQAWVYPSGGKSHGVYGLHGAALQPATLREHLYLAPARPVDSFVARHLSAVPLAYRQWEYRLVPAFALYEWGGASFFHGPPSPGVDVAPVDASIAALTGTGSRMAPISLDGPFLFLGVATYAQGEALEVETWWQVAEGPITRPLSIMAHLLASDGAVLGIADGLGVSPAVLVPGDVVVQRHRFPRPQQGAAAWLRTGAYWLDTMERWPVADTPGDNALFVPLDASS